MKKKTSKKSEVDGKKETVKSFSWNLVSKVITYLLLIVLGNYYLISEYGKATFILSIYNILAIVTAFGMPNTLVPWIIRKKDYKSVFRGLFYLSFIVAVGTILISFFAIKARGYNPELIYPIIIISIAIVFYWLNSLAASFLIVKKKYGLIGFMGAASILVTLILAIFLKNIQGFGIVVAYFAGFIFSAVYLIIVEKDNFMKVWDSFKVDISVLKYYFKEGLVISIVSLSFYFLNWINSTILGVMTNLENVGKYNIANAFSNAIMLIPLSLSMFVITRMSELNSIKKSKAVLKRVIRISYGLTVIASVLLASYLFILVKIFFPKYVGIELFSAILLVGVVFNSVYILVYNYFIAKIKIRENAFPVFLSALVNIIAAVILIPFIGIYGACIAYTLSSFIAFILLSKGIFSYKEMFVMTLLSFSILIAYYISYFGIILAAVITLIFLKIKILEKEDINLVKNGVFSVLKR